MIVKETKDYDEDNHGARRWKRCVYCNSTNIKHYINMNKCVCNDCKEDFYEETFSA